LGVGVDVIDSINFRIDLGRRTLYLSSANLLPA
jgi:hypothetical protein